MNSGYGFSLFHPTTQVAHFVAVETPKVLTCPGAGRCDDIMSMDFQSYIWCRFRLPKLLRCLDLLDWSQILKNKMTVSFSFKYYGMQKWATISAMVKLFLFFLENDSPYRGQTRCQWKLSMVMGKHLKLGMLGWFHKSIMSLQMQIIQTHWTTILRHTQVLRFFPKRN